MWRRHRDAILVSLMVLAYFLFFTGRGLRLPLRPGDLASLQHASPPAVAVFLDVLRTLYGSQPLGYRLTMYALLIANIGLVYLLARRVAGSRETGAVGALLFAYHHRLGALYTRLAQLPDILGVLLFLACLWCVEKGFAAEVRRNRRRWWGAGAVAGAAAMAMFAMGWSVPLVVLWQVLLRPRRSPPHRWLWLASAAWGALLIALAPRYGGQVLTPAIGRGAFRVWMYNARHYLDEVVCSPAPLVKNSYVWVLIGCLLLLAMVVKRREVRWAVMFLLATSVPLAYLEPRGLEGVYLPWAGLCVLLAAGLTAGRDYLLQRLWRRPALPSGAWEPERIFSFWLVVFLMTAASLFDPFHQDDFAGRRGYSSGVTVFEIWSAFLRPDAWSDPRNFRLPLTNRSSGRSTG